MRGIDRVIHASSTDMAAVADGSVALVVTSPPYFAGKAYETELDADHVRPPIWSTWRCCAAVFAECVRKLEPGGRIAVNVANLGRRPYRSLSADITAILQDDLRLLLRGEIIWVKQRGASGSCAWGSFQRAGNPVLRDLTERVIVASKGRFDRAVSQTGTARRNLPNESTLYKDEFMEATLDMWEIPPESARRVEHPAPFPVELPERLINLYTYQGDLVLDPFMGSGTTGVAAVRTGRHYVGYDTDADYVERATARIAAARIEAGGVVQRTSTSRCPGPGSPSGGRTTRATSPGRPAEGRAPRSSPGRCSISPDSARSRQESKSVVSRSASSCATPRGGASSSTAPEPFNSSRPGLKRTETCGRPSGAPRCSSSRCPREEHETGTDVVLISTDVPAQGSAGGERDRGTRPGRHADRGGHDGPARASTCSHSSRRDCARAPGGGRLVVGTRMSPMDGRR